MRRSGIAAKVEPKEVITAFPVDGTLRQVLFQELFMGPCKCCGDNRHGILNTAIDLSGQEDVYLACPVIETGQSWENVLRSGLRTMNFKPDPTKFAVYFQQETANAIREFRRHGQGKPMGYMPLVDFDNDVHRIIDDLRSDPKRRIYPESHRDSKL